MSFRSIPPGFGVHFRLMDQVVGKVFRMIEGLSLLFGGNFVIPTFELCKVFRIIE